MLHKMSHIYSLINFLNGRLLQHSKLMLAMLFVILIYNQGVSQVKTFKLNKTDILSYQTLIDKSLVDFSQINLCKVCAINNALSDSIYKKVFFILNSSSTKNAKEFSSKKIQYNPTTRVLLDWFRKWELDINKSFILWLDTSANRMTVKYYNKNNYKDIVNTFFYVPLKGGKKTSIPSAGSITSSGKEKGMDAIINQYGNKYYPFSDSSTNDSAIYQMLGIVAGFDQLFCEQSYNYLLKANLAPMKYIRCGNSNDSYWEVLLIYYPNILDSGRKVIDFRYFLRTIDNYKDTTIAINLNRSDRFKYEVPEAFADIRNDTFLVMNYNLNRKIKLNSQPLFTEHVFSKSKINYYQFIDSSEMKKIIKYCPDNYDVLYHDRKFTFLEYAPLIINNKGVVCKLDYLMDLFNNKKEYQVPKIKNVALVGNRYIVDFVIGYSFYKVIYDLNLKLENIYIGSTFPYYMLSTKSTNDKFYGYFNDDFYQFNYNKKTK